MSRRKTNNRCGGCEHFIMDDTWRMTCYGIFCEGTCKGTGKRIHNQHYACKHFFKVWCGSIWEGSTDDEITMEKQQ